MAFTIIASYPGLPTQLFRGCEKSCVGRPGYEASFSCTLQYQSLDRLTFFSVVIYRKESTYIVHISRGQMTMPLGDSYYVTMSQDLEVCCTRNAL